LSEKIWVMGTSESAKSLVCAGVDITGADDVDWAHSALVAGIDKQDEASSLSTLRGSAA
jgi:hypothetical protein